MNQGRTLASLAFIVGFAVLGTATSPAPVSAPLTEGGRLAAIYNTILRARFDEANQELSKTCPPAPTEACRTLRAVVLWWQTLMDPDNPALDNRLRQEARASLEAADAWTRREPRNAEAWFYLAGSHAPLAQLQALRGERLAAARSGLNIKSALERALRFDPQLADAQFGIGMYHYWADVAPLAAKLLRMLLLLPGGDREKGLREMLESRERIAIVGGEADFQLHWIYLWFEKNPTEALRLIKSLGARYPTNPLFLQRIAEIECQARHDHKASRAAWESLLDRALQKQVEMPGLAETRSRLGLAHELLEMSQPQQAIDVLNAVIQARATAPYAAQSIAHVHLGDAYDRLGKRDLAVTAYNNAIALMPAHAPADIRTRARDGLRKRAR